MRHRSIGVVGRRAAFTLIELLVVISIIALLVGILLPVLSGARERGHQLVSANNMRQIGWAMSLYQDEFDGWFPQTSHGNPDKSTAWLFTLAPYVTDARQVPDPDNPSVLIDEIGRVRICPADPKGEARYASGGTSYVLNEWVFVPAFTGNPFNPSIDWDQTFMRSQALTQTSTTHTMFVGADGLGLSATNDHTHSRSWNTWADVRADIEPDRYGRQDKPDDSVGSSNYLFADTHVEEWRASDARELIESGVNFSRPNR